MFTLLNCSVVFLYIQGFIVLFTDVYCFELLAFVCECELSLQTPLSRNIVWYLSPSKFLLDWEGEHASTTYAGMEGADKRHKWHLRPAENACAKLPGKNCSQS